MSLLRTTKEPNTGFFRSRRKEFDRLAFRFLNVEVFAMFKPYGLCVDREVHVSIRRVETFLKITRLLWENILRDSQSCIPGEQPNQALDLQHFLVRL